MSLTVLNEVLDSSRTKGSARLLLVVLAEQAHEDGLTWPGIPRLARRVGTSERNVQYLLRDLEESGELIIERGAGRGNTNEYRVLPPATAGRVIEELTAHLEKVKSSAEKVKTSALLEKVKNCAEKVKESAQKVKSRAEKVKHVSPEPTGTIEPTEEPTADRQAVGQSGIQDIELAQQGSTSGADAPSGADGVGATPVTGSPQPPAGQTGQATSTADVPPAGAALAALTSALAGLRQPVAELIAEYPDRQGWLELPAERIRTLQLAARLEHGGRYRGALIEALDAEVRSRHLQAVAPTQTPGSPMARRRFP